jgi:hypothetical protein
MNKSLIQIFLIFIVALIFIKTDYRLESDFYCCKDDYDYYAHAETIAIDGDFDYSNQLVGNEESRFFHNGKSAPSGFFGTGLLSSPFVYMGNLFNKAFLNNSMYNFIVIFYSLSSLFYLTFTFLIFNKINSLLGNKIHPYLIHLYILGSGIGYFVFERYSMTHVYEIFSISLVIYFTIKYRDSKSSYHAFVIPILVLLSILTRWVNIYSLFLPFLILKLLSADTREYLRNKYFLLASFLSICIFAVHSYLIYGVITFNPEFTYNTSGSLQSFLEIENSIVSFITLNIKNLFVFLFSFEFGIFWFSPIVFFGFYLGIKNLLFRSKSLKSKIINIVYLFCFSQIFSLVLLWRSTGSSYGYRYTFNLCAISVLYILVNYNLSFLEKQYLKYMSVFSCFSVLFFETTLGTQLSLVSIVNSFGRTVKFSQPNYLTGFIESLVSLEAYLKIGAQSLLGLFIFSVALQFMSILNLNEKLGVISAEVYNSDLQTLFVKIDTIEFYKVLLTIVIVFFLSTIFVKNTHLYIRAYENTK